jgi:tetratricopeptide (TPR) repeat protein
MIIAAYLNRNSNQLKEAFIGLKSLENEPVTKLKNEASYLYLRYNGCNDNYALKELQNLTSQLEIYPYAYFLIGRCYEDSNNFEKAAEAFEISAQAYQIEKERADSAIAVSRCLFKAGKQQKAFARLMAEIRKIIDSEIVSKVYESLAALYDEAKDSDVLLNQCHCPFDQSSSFASSQPHLRICYYFCFQLRFGLQQSYCCFNKRFWRNLLLVTQSQ